MKVVRVDFCDGGCSSPSCEDASTLSARLWAEYRELFFGRVQKWLDAGYGACPLKDERVRAVVEDALLHFNGVRYVVYSYVVMPNHVHVLFMPLDGFSLTDILRSWKGFTAREVNRALNRTGVFWQKESWDHLVRNERQFAKYLSYIRANDGTKAYDVYETMHADAERQR